MEKDQVIEQLRQENQELHATVHILNSRLAALSARSDQIRPTLPCACAAVPSAKTDLDCPLTPVGQDASVEHHHKQNVERLAKVCYELQQIQGNKPFWLSSRHVGAILNVSHTQTVRYIHELLLDGVLEVVESHAGNRATRYRYIESLKGRAKPSQTVAHSA